MPLPLLAVPAAIQAATAIGGGISKVLGGKSDYEKNKEQLDSLADPFYKIQDEYFQNRNSAANEAQSGFSAETKDYYTTEAQRGLGSSLNAVSMGGGGVNDVSRILDTYNRGIRGTVAQDEQLRMQKMSEFYNRNKDLAGQKTIQWHLNEYQPNQNKMALYSGNMVNAKQNQTQGWNDILGGISAASSSFMNAQAGAASANGGAPFTPKLVDATTVSPFSREYAGTPQLQSNPNPMQMSSYLTNPSYAAASTGNSYTPPNWGFIQ